MVFYSDCGPVAFSQYMGLKDVAFYSDCGSVLHLHIEWCPEVVFYSDCGPLLHFHGKYGPKMLYFTVIVAFLPCHRGRRWTSREPAASRPGLLHALGGSFSIYSW